MRYLLILICCLIPFLSYASGPQVLVQGTAAGTTQLRLSTVDGTAFIDTDGTVPCTSFVGEAIAICDSANKCIKGFIKAAGDGEDLDAEKFTDPIYENDAAWTIGSGWTVNAAASGKAEATTSTANLTEALTYTAGALYKLVTNCDALTGGTYQAIIEGTAIGTAVNTTAAVSWYRTASAATSATNGTKATTSLSATFTGISLKQVTGPSATGCTIVSTKDGATYNWNIKETGFDPNSATFTYRILSTNIPGQQIASGTVSATDVKLATVDGGAMVEITGVDLSPYAGVDSFSPPSTNLQLHLKADAGCYTDAGKTTACASDADKVYVWEDQSGNGNDAVQATEGYRPLWKTNIVGTLPAMRFDNSDDKLSFASGFMNGWTNLSFYIVHNSTIESNGGLFAPQTYAKGFEIFSTSNNSTLRINGDYRISPTGSSRFWGPSTKTINSVIGSTSSVKAYKSGFNVGMLSSAAMSALNFNGVYDIGAYSNTFYIGTDIYEILIYNTAHDDITRTQIERYLAGKWGISYTPTVYGASPAKYLLCLYDSSSRVACGYVGAAGGGETLGAEIATGTLTAGKLYKITATEANHFYTGCAIGEYFTSVGTETCDASNKVQEVTEVEATGLHGHSTPNATDRKMSLKTTGFDPNTVTSYKIYRTY